MSAQELSGRRYLLSYQYIDELNDFLATICVAADKYQYVSATERRCFNLIARYTPELSNLVSNNGLILQYREFADFFEINGRFPRVLVVDDIMIHGRGIAKFLYQFENLLAIELEYRKVLNSAEDHYYFRRMFTRAVDIFIYAKSEQDMLLEDRFMRNLRCWKTLNLTNLRDLSMQLTDSMAQWEIPNTSFVMSFQCKELTNALSWEQPKEWICVPWKYHSEEMRQFIRPYGSAMVNRISTIRFFPERTMMGASQITSFTMMGDIKTSDIQRIARELYEILNPVRFPNLCSVLAEENYPALLQAKSQLINCLLSISDLYEFIEINGLAIWIENMENDADKIARNFGTLDNLLPEFTEILSKRLLVKEIREMLDSFLKSSAMPLIAISPARCHVSGILSTEEDEQEEINKNVSYIFYNVGIRAEEHALRYDGKPYSFSPEYYLSYKPGGDQYGTDGVISVDDFFDITIKPRNPIERIYRLIAACVAAMDNGIMGVRLHVTDNGAESRLITLSKAGEMAVFYFPRLLSMYIPAFARIEWRSYLTGLTKSEAILKFFSERNDSELMDAFENDNDIQEWKKKKLPTKAELEEILGWFLKCKQSFRGWNFKNIYYQSDRLQRRYQWFLEKKAMQFLGSESK